MRPEPKAHDSGWIVWEGPGWTEGGSTGHEEKKRDERGAHLEGLVPT